MHYDAFRGAKMLCSPTLLERTGHELGGGQTTGFEQPAGQQPFCLQGALCAMLRGLVGYQC